MLPKRTRSADRAQFLSDLLTGAVEGSIGYWSQVSEYHWYSPTLEGGSAEHPEGQANSYVTVHEDGADNDGDDGNVVRTIGVDDIARALGEIRKTPHREGPEWLHEDYVKAILAADRTNDTSELDAISFDAIVQIALFGKVVYG